MSALGSFPCHISIFSGLDEVALGFLFERCQKIEVPAGEVVLREGDFGNRLFLIGSGRVRVCKQKGEKEVELAVLEAGAFFGEMCILETLPRTASVISETRAVLFQMSSMVFRELYHRMPGQYGLLLLNMARDLSRRLRRLDESFAARH